MKIILTDRADRYRDRPWSLPWKLVTLSFLPTGQPISQTICVRLAHESDDLPTKSICSIVHAFRLRSYVTTREPRTAEPHERLCASACVRPFVCAVFFFSSQASPHEERRTTQREEVVPQRTCGLSSALCFSSALSMSRTNSTIALRSPQAHLLRKAWRA